MKIPKTNQILIETQFPKVRSLLNSSLDCASAFKLLIFSCSFMLCDSDTNQLEGLTAEEKQADEQSGETRDLYKVPQSKIFPTATASDLEYYEEAMAQFCSPISKIHGFVHRKVIDTALLILAKSLYPKPPRIQKYTNFYIGEKLDVVIKDNLKPAHTIERKDGSFVHLWEYLETNTKPFWPLSLFQQPYRLHIVLAINVDKDNIVTREILTVEHGIFEILRLPVNTKTLLRFWS